MTKAIKKLSELIALTVICSLLFSCASSSRKAEAKPLAVLGVGADMYFYVPVKENKPLVENLMSIMAGMDENDASLLASRIDSLYISIGKDVPESVKVYAEGSFPSIGQKMALKEKNGWEKNSYTPKDSSEKIEYYSSVSGFNVAFPTTKILIASQDIFPMLDNYTYPHAELPECESWFDGQEHDDKAMLFYVVEPASFMRKMVGSIAEKWCDNVYGEIKKDGKTSSYYATLYLELSNPKTQKSLEGLIKALTGIEVSSVGDNVLKIQDLKLSEQDVMNVLR